MRIFAVALFAILAVGCSSEPEGSNGITTEGDLGATNSGTDAGDDQPDSGTSNDADGTTDVADAGSLPDATGGNNVARGWSNRQSLPSAQQETSVLAFDGLIWVLGGFNAAGQEIPTVRTYDPATDSWEGRADFPLPAHHMNAALVDGQIWVTGFLAGGFGSDGRTFVYDPDTDSWSPGADQPAGRERGSSAVAVLDGTIYLAGGMDGGNAFPYVDALDTATGEWRQLPDMPRNMDHGGFGVIDGKLIVAAGRNGSIQSHSDAVNVFDLATEQWSAGAPIPTARGGVASAVLDGKLYVFGGEGNPGAPGQVFSEVEAYDPATDTWEQLEEMPIPRHGLGAAALDGVIYLPGGGDAIFLAATDAHDAFVP